LRIASRGGGVSAVLAFDIGGTSVRAALIDAEGRIEAAEAVEGPAAGGRPGWSEIDPDDWWRLFLRCAVALRARAPESFAAIAAIAGCGVTRT
jgi:xylulokinase